MRQRRFASLIGLALAAFGLSCSDLPARYCAVGGECDDFTGLLLDPVTGSSADSVDVCTVGVETELSVYRVNREAICSEVAQAYEVYLDCVVRRGCDAFRVEESDCKDEYNDWQDLKGEAQNRCSE